MVSSGGGDPPCVCSGFVSSCAIEGCATPRFWGGLRLVAAGRRFAAGRAFSLVRRFLVVRGVEVARRFAVSRRFEVVRRFTGFRFFRDEREVAARFLRFAIVGSCWGRYSTKENLPAKRGLRAARLTCHCDRVPCGPPPIPQFFIGQCLEFANPKSFQRRGICRNLVAGSEGVQWPITL